MNIYIPESCMWHHNCKTITQVKHLMAQFNWWCSVTLCRGEFPTHNMHGKWRRIPTPQANKHLLNAYNNQMYQSNHQMIPWRTHTHDTQKLNDLMSTDLLWTCSEPTQSFLILLIYKKAGEKKKHIRGRKKSA